MGEVYRARDTRLGRDVAIKILPERLASDPAAVARFEQEGRAVAALSHPNILAIHDVGHQDGVAYAVTELLDGDTLRDRLTGGHVPLKKAIEYAVHIALGLAAAHAKGITHRDIKPENLFVTSDGHVKILDFGLAKVHAPSADVTRTGHLPTDPGTVLGTAGYLSPEQAQGHPVDHRSDMFSLGAVLYEMATGLRAFKGDSAIDSLHKIIHSEPAPLDAAAPEAPAELRWVLAKCLAKDPDERYQSTRDLVLDLRNVGRALESSPRMTVRLGPSTRPSWGRQSAALVALVLVAATVAAALWWRGRGSAAGGVSTALERLSIEPVTALGTVIHGVISPDGKYVAYIVSENARQSLWIRQLATASTLQLVPPSAVGFWGANFSPDSSEIYYVVYTDDQPDRALYRIPALGGTPRKLLTGFDSFPVFSPDGRRIAYMRNSYPEPATSSLMVADVDGTNARALATRRPPEFFVPIFFTAPAWSPDGSVIICPMLRRQGSQTIGTLVAVRAADGTEAPFPHYEWSGIGQAIWTPDGQSLVVVAGDEGTSNRPNQLWWVSAREQTRRKITSDLLDYRTVSLTADASTIVTVAADSTSSIWTIPLDGGEPRRVSAGRYDGLSGIAAAPGGRILYRSVESGSASIWIMDEDGTQRTQVTLDGVTSFPAVTPDGRAIVFERESAGLWTIGLDGQNARAVPNTIAAERPAVTPDGKWILYTLPTTGVEQLWKVPADGSAPPSRMLAPRAYRPSVSPDSTRVAFYYQEHPNAAFVLAVMPLNGTRPTQTFNVAPSGGYAAVRWTADGKALLHNSNVGDRANIWLQPVSGGPPRQVTRFVDQNILGFDRSIDGKHLIIARGHLSRDAMMIRNFR